jgi:hypothetical protein
VASQSGPPRPPLLTCHKTDPRRRSSTPSSAAASTSTPASKRSRSELFRLQPLRGSTCIGYVVSSGFLAVACVVTPSVRLKRSSGLRAKTFVSGDIITKDLLLCASTRGRQHKYGTIEPLHIRSGRQLDRPAPIMHPRQRRVGRERHLLLHERLLLHECREGRLLLLERSVGGFLLLSGERFRTCLLVRREIGTDAELTAGSQGASRRQGRAGCLARAASRLLLTRATA